MFIPCADNGKNQVFLKASVVLPAEPKVSQVTPAFCLLSWKALQRLLLIISHTDRFLGMEPYHAPILVKTSQQNNTHEKCAVMLTFTLRREKKGGDWGE